MLRDVVLGLVGVAICALAGFVLGNKADREINRWKGRRR